jgi:hypothetical protein
MMQRDEYFSHYRTLLYWAVSHQILLLDMKCLRPDARIGNDLTWRLVTMKGFTSVVMVNNSDEVVH